MLKNIKFSNQQILLLQSILRPFLNINVFTFLDPPLPMLVDSPRNTVQDYNSTRIGKDSNDFMLLHAHIAPKGGDAQDPIIVFMIYTESIEIHQTFKNVVPPPDPLTFSDIDEAYNKLKELAKTTFSL